MGSISLHQGDITADSRTEAIVNAANSSLLAFSAALEDHRAEE